MAQAGEGSTAVDISGRSPAAAGGNAERPEILTTDHCLRVRPERWEVLDVQVNALHVRILSERAGVLRLAGGTDCTVRLPPRRGLRASTVSDAVEFARTLAFWRRPASKQG